MRRANQIHFGTASNHTTFNRSNFGRTVTALLMMLACVVAVLLDRHAVVNVSTESVLYGLNVRAQTVAGNLRTIAKARSYVSNESVRRYVIAFAYFVRGNDLRFGVDSAERPNVAKRRI